MPWAFRRTEHGYEARLDPGDAALFRELGGHLLAVLDQRDRDPAAERLFPDGRRDDPEAAAELRGLIEDDLRELKRDDARALTELPSDATVLRLDDEQAERWLRALNDLRLVFGTRLGVTEDLDLDAITEDHPDAFGYAVYDLLSLVQDSLLRVLRT